MKEIPSPEYKHIDLMDDYINYKAKLQPLVKSETPMSLRKTYV